MFTKFHQICFLFIVFKIFISVETNSMVLSEKINSKVKYFSRFLETFPDFLKTLKALQGRELFEKFKNKELRGSRQNALTNPERWCIGSLGTNVSFIP